MARTHTFKGSASAGYGYFAYIEDGQLVIGEDWGREGGILYKGPFDCKDADKHLAMLRKNAPKLYENILRYYAKEEAAKEAYYVRYRFKDSRDRYGNGYSGYINIDGLLIIEQDDPRGGGVRFEGKYEEMPPVLAKLLVELRTWDPVLYDDIEKYFTKHGVSDESDKRADGSYCDSNKNKKTESSQATDMDMLKNKYNFDEASKTILFKVKLFMDNGVVHKVLVRGRFQADVIKKLMPQIPEVLTLQTWDAREFAVRSNKIDAVEFMED